MSNKRASLNLGDEPEIDLAELVKKASPSPKMTPELKSALDKEGEKLGFVSREKKKMGRRRTSPYTAQFGGKCRDGMKPLFQEIGQRMDIYDTETLELAILALLEKQGYKDLQEDWNKLVKDNQ